MVAMTDRSDRSARCLVASRPIARYTVDRATPNRSPSSAVLYSPDFSNATRCASCRGLSLGCLPRSRPLALAILMPFLGAQSDEVGLEFGDHGQHVEQQPADRVGRVVDGSAEAEPDPSSREFVGDRPGVGQGAGEPVEFGHDQRVAVSAGCQRFAEAWSVAVATGQPVVDVDPVGGDTQRGESFPLDGEVLFVGGASGVSDEKRRHGAPPRLGRSGATLPRSPATAATAASSPSAQCVEIGTWRERSQQRPSARRRSQGPAIRAAAALAKAGHAAHDLGRALDDAHRSWPTWPPPNPTAPTNRGQTRRPTPRAPSESQARALATVGQKQWPPAGTSRATSGQVYGCQWAEIDVP